MLDWFTQLSPWFQLPIVLLIAVPIAFVIALLMLRGSDWVAARTGRTHTLIDDSRAAVPAPTEGDRGSGTGTGAMPGAVARGSVRWVVNATDDVTPQPRAELD